MKKNITASPSVTYVSKKRKPLLHNFVTNLIASFGDVTSLKRYAMFMFSFLLLLLMSGSYSLFAKENQNYSFNNEIVVIDSIDELSVHQKEAVLNSGTQTPFPSAENQVYLMNHPAQAFPYTIYLGGQSNYSVDSIALTHYGSTEAVKHILAANPSLDFNALKTGDRVYLPLINPDLLLASAPTSTESEVSSADAEIVGSELSQESEPLQVNSEPSTEVAVATESPILETSAPVKEPVVYAPVETMPAASGTASYVVPASAEVVDMFVRFVAAESSPNWDYEGHLMIAQTIINRAMDGRWGDLEGVMTSPGQYDVYTDGRYLTINVTDSQRQAALDALHGATAFERDVIYFCTDYAYSSSSWWASLDKRASYGNTLFFAP